MVKSFGKFFMTNPGCAGIGIQGGLRIRRPKGHEGSSPSIPTRWKKTLSSVGVSLLPGQISGTDIIVDVVETARVSGTEQWGSTPWVPAKCVRSSVGRAADS